MTCTLVLALALAACLPTAPAPRLRLLRSGLPSDRGIFAGLVLRAALPAHASVDHEPAVMNFDEGSLSCPKIKERFEKVYKEVSMAYIDLEAFASADEKENLVGSWTKLKDIMERLHRLLRQLDVLMTELGGNRCPNGPKVADIQRIRAHLQENICREKMKQFQNIWHGVANEGYLPVFVQQLDWLETSLAANSCPNGPKISEIQHLSDSCPKTKELFEEVNEQVSRAYSDLEALASADEKQDLGGSWTKLKEILERFHQLQRQLNLLLIESGFHPCPDGPKVADIQHLRAPLQENICKEKMKQFQKIRHAAAKEGPSLGDNLQHLPELVQQLDWLETSLEGNRCPNGPELKDIQRLWESLREDMKQK